MMHEVLDAIQEELQQFLQLKGDMRSGDVVTLGNLVMLDGSSNPDQENSLVMSVINIERDGNAQQGGKRNPEMNINLYVLFAANFSDYRTGLAYLSAVIGFFQERTVIDHTQFPSLPGSVGKLKAELMSIDWRELSNLWSALGAKYLPSIVIRLRSLNIEEEDVELIPLIGA